MMIRRYDFKCTQCEHIEEHWVDTVTDAFVTCLNVVTPHSG
jgi:hypothetical protein